MAETLIAAAPYLFAASTAVSTVGSIVGAQQQQSALNARAAYDQQAAEQSRVNAASALNVGEAEVQRMENQQRRKLASAFNQGAASGVDPSFGSPLDLMGDMAAEGSLDTQIQRWKAKNQATQYLTQAQGYSAQAGMDAQGAADAGSAGVLRAGTTLLGGLSSYAMMRTRMGTA